MVKILVDRDGVVRITDAALRQAGFAVPRIDVPRLRLRQRGQETPILVRTPPNPKHGAFELSFVGRFLRGERTFENEFTRTNTYVLDLAPPGSRPARLTKRMAPLPPPGAPRVTASLHTIHAEINRRLIRFVNEMPDETWFWEQVKATDTAAAPFRIDVDRVSPAGSFTLRVAFKGYSALEQSPDHTVDVAWNGTTVGRAVWDGEARYTLEVTVDGSLLREGPNELALRATGETTFGVDLVLLDWVEVSYARAHSLGEDGQLSLAAAGSTATVIKGAGTRPLLVFDTRTDRVWETTPKPGAGAVFRGDGLPEEDRYVAVRAGRGYEPKAIVVSHPEDLRASGRGAAFVIVTHKTLRPAAARLAAVREAEGLTTAVVDVDDIYDRFRDGVFHPEAIREFLAHAYRTWSPQPRYVLLMGDASWDYKNRLVSDELYADWHWGAGGALEVPRNESTPYEPGPVENVRGLVPTFQWQSPWGHAASDNHFALVDGEDDLPDLAVGRFPVVTLAEAQAIVDKTLAQGHAEPGETGEALFITDDIEYHQSRSDDLAKAAEKAGLAPAKIYPRAEELDNRVNTQRIIDAFDRGKTIVVFAGHGGRYIWRTGPPDLKKNHDLFTTAHLDQLQPGTRFPLVVSLTCYSAPFDHPTADSIGEKLLRIPGRGALAVVASSWRNVPPFTLAQKLIERLGTADAPRIGDAFLRAMREPEDSVALNTYNLLGDPSAPFVLPASPKSDEATNHANR